MASGLENPRHQQPRQQTVNRDDGHGFTPVPLGWWYLSSVLGYIVLLLAILEYSFHAIPQTTNRQTTPPTYFKVPPSGMFKRADRTEQHPTTPRARHVITRRNSTNNTNSTFPIPSNTTKPCNLDILESITPNTTNPTALENCTITSSDFQEPSRFKILHLDPSQFASLEPKKYLTHYRLHFIWVHDTTGRLYIPVFPGMDISQRCTYYGQYMYITSNKQDCTMLVEIDDFGTTYFQPIFQHEGDKCYDEWYTFTEQYAGQWRWQPQISGNDWDKSECWEDEWDSGRIILYPSRVVSWPAGWPTGTDATAPAGGSNGDIAVPTPTTMVTTLPPIISEVTTTSMGPDGRPTTSVFTTTLPGRVVTTVFDIRPTPTPNMSVTVGGTVMTLTNSVGQPTATTTSFFTTGLPGVIIPSPSLAPSVSLSTEILTNSLGEPTATNIIPITITPNGINTAPPPTISITLQTIYNQNGQIISTSTGYILPILPHPSPEIPSPPADWPFPGESGGDTTNINDIPSQGIKVQPLTWQSYFIGSFLPVLSTTILSILVQVLNGSLRAMIPFLALSRTHYHGPGDGVSPTAAESLLLPLEGNLLRLDTALLLAWRHKEPLLLMSNLLQIIGMVLASLSSEAIGMTLGGGCTDDSFEGCFMSLAVVTGPARAAEGLLVAMGVLLLLVMVGIWFLGRRQTGPSLGVEKKRKSGLLTTPGGMNPTSIMAAAAMLAGEDSKSLRELLSGSGSNGPGQGKNDSVEMMISDKDIRDRLEGHRFAVNSEGQVIIVTDTQSSSERSKTGLTATSSVSKHKLANTGRRITDLLERSYEDFTSRHKKMVLLMEYGYRLLFLVALGTLLFIVAYYGSAQHGPKDPIESFMNSQTFGVSFLFTGAGGMIDFFWGGFFSRTELQEPYRSLSQPPSSTSISASRSTTNMTRPRSSSIFSGLLRALKNRNILLSSIAFAGVLSKFLPVVLSNVPFRLALPWTTYIICTWISVSVLAVMILVMMGSFLVTWKQQVDLPFDVGTIAGRMYYVCDSWVIKDMGDIHVHVDTGKVLNTDMEVKYRFGKIVGASGILRMLRTRSMYYKFWLVSSPSGSFVYGSLTPRE